MCCDMSWMKILISLFLFYTVIIILYGSGNETIILVASYIRGVNVDTPANISVHKLPKMKIIEASVKHQQDWHSIKTMRTATIQQEFSTRTRVTPQTSAKIKPNPKDDSGLSLQEELDLAARTLMSTEQEWLPQMKYQTIYHTKSGFDRANLVQERCRLLKQNINNHQALQTHSVYERQTFIVHKTMNLTFCINCKVASTSTKMFLYTFDTKQTSRPAKAKKYSHDFFQTREQALSHGFMNVTFVREPLERLLSAYRDNKGFPTEMMSHGDFSFKEFLNRTLKSNKANLNRHTFPYVSRCLPCYVNYNFVVMQVTFDEDMADIMERQHIPTRKYNVRDRDDMYSKHSEDKVKGFYRDIPNETIHKLWEMYYLDYFVFGFPYPLHLIKK